MLVNLLAHHHQQPRPKFKIHPNLSLKEGFDTETLQFLSLPVVFYV